MGLMVVRPVRHWSKLTSAVLSRSRSAQTFGIFQIATLPSPWSGLSQPHGFPRANWISAAETDLLTRRFASFSCFCSAGRNCPSGSPCMRSTLRSGFGPAGLFRSGMNVLLGVFNHMQSNIPRPISHSIFDQTVSMSTLVGVMAAVSTEQTSHPRLLRLPAKSPGLAWSSAEQNQRHRPIRRGRALRSPVAIAHLHVCRLFFGVTSGRSP